MWQVWAKGGDERGIGVTVGAAEPVVEMGDGQAGGLRGIGECAQEGDAVWSTRHGHDD